MQQLFRITAFAALAVALAAGPTLAAAQSSSGASASGNIQTLVQEYQKKSQKLQQIRQKTLQNNADLRQKQEEYRDMVMSAMKEQGYDVEAGRARLQEIAKKLQSGNMSQSKRKQLMQKFQAERRQLTQARRKVMSQPEIQQAREELKQATLSAMNEQNPKTDELIASMKKIQQKMRNSMQQSQGG